ncbi:MAG TPA: hypothetical protein VHX16_15065 [Chloroflexota bacterium]|jgi:hypothetical protein|nr:hypothetical protein [Chloroflexota bacterium]
MLRIALVIFGLIVGLICSEIVLRLRPPIPEEDILPFSFKEDELERIIEGDAYIRFDPELGWAATESSARRDGKITYLTNSAGMRSDHEIPLDRAPAVTRLASFGDSFTFCDEVNNSECWASALEQEWPGVEVLNFGVPAYGPDQAWLRYQRDGAKYQPCGVIIGYMVENIHRVVNRFRPFYRPETGIVLSKPRFLWDGGQLTLLPNPATRPEMLEDMHWVESALGPNDPWYYRGMFQGGPLDLLQSVRMAKTIGYQRRLGVGTEDGDTSKRLGWAYQPDQEAFQVASHVLMGFASDVRVHGSSPVVVVFPRKEEVINMRDTRTKAHQPLLDTLESAGVPTIDVTDILLRQARARGVDSLIDKHYTARGNRAVGEALAKMLPPLMAPSCGTTPDPTLAHS